MLIRLAKRWWNWVNYLEPTPEEPAVPVEEIKPPVDLWDQMFEMAMQMDGITVQPMGVWWFDHKLLLYTDSLLELVSRLEMLVRCVEAQEEAPASWEDRRREVEVVSIPDYYYDVRVGYRSPQTVVDNLVEKVLVIHHLLDSHGLDRRSSYVIYMKRTFQSIAMDVKSVLQASLQEAVEVA